MLRAIQAVQKVQDKIWIPEEVHRLTFFGINDLWEYHAVYDDRLCEECKDKEAEGIYQGSILRLAFPFLEIIDIDVIHVNVHPNCRCRLLRTS